MTNRFDDIRPYTDQEAVKALRRVAFNPLSLKISKYCFPEQSCFHLSKQLLKCTGIQDFQQRVMDKIVSSVLSKTSEGVSVQGVENLDKLDGRALFISNHRDIVMDPAILQQVLLHANQPLTELCVGNNLLESGFLKDIMFSNRMVKVRRGLPAHELISASQHLSEYIREAITSGRAGIWIAQRSGRSKDSSDLTAQAIVKMLDMSGKGSFAENFDELNIVPVSISYEYESCDILRARELVISRNRKYVKKPGEDTHSILTGITQKKGRICISFGEPLQRKDLEEAGKLSGNERFRALTALLNRSIHNGYRPWPTNYIAADLLNGSQEYSKHYTLQEKEAFCSYMEYQMDTIKKERLDSDALKETFLKIYANPILRLQ